MSTMTDTPTPRTDAKAEEALGCLSLTQGWDAFKFMESHAKQLERDLTAANSRIADLEQEITDLKKVQQFESRMGLAAHESAKQLERAAREGLKAADDKFQEICGAYVAVDHGESMEPFWEAIRTMGPAMDAVRKALATFDALTKKADSSENNSS